MQDNRVNCTGIADIRLASYLHHESFNVITTTGRTIRRSPEPIGIIIVSTETNQPLLLITELSDEDIIRVLLRIDPSFTLFGPSIPWNEEATDIKNIATTHEITGKHAYYKAPENFLNED